MSADVAQNQGIHQRYISERLAGLTASAITARTCPSTDSTCPVPFILLVVNSLLRLLEIQRPCIVLVAELGVASSTHGWEGLGRCPPTPSHKAGAGNVCEAAPPASKIESKGNRQVRAGATWAMSRVLGNRVTSPRSRLSHLASVLFDSFSFLPHPIPRPRARSELLPEVRCCTHHSHLDCM